MIIDEGIRFILWDKGQNYSKENKVHLKYLQNLPKLKLQTRDGDETPLLEDSTFSLWRHSESKQNLHNRVLWKVKIIVNIGRTIHRASSCVLGGLFFLWLTAICPVPKNKMEANFTFPGKKANFNLRVIGVNKWIRFFHYIKRSPDTRK